MSQAPSILLIDDNEQIRQVAGDLLREEFPHCLIHEIDSLSGLQQALAAGGFNLAITDYQLGWTDGLTVLRKVKRRYPDCPVVMFTGTGSEEIAVEAMKAGLDDYVLKSSTHIGRLAASVRTALTQAEERRMARETEARYRSLIHDVLDTSTGGFFILDAEFKVVWINAAMERYFGIRRADVLGQDKRQLLQGVIRPIVDQPTDFAERVLQTYVDNRWEETFECHIRPDEGREERWLEHRSLPIRTGLYTGGRIEHYYNITARKQVEQALAASEQHYRLLFDNNPHPMWVFDVESLAILEVNEAAVVNYGYSKDEFLAKTIKDLRPPEEVPALLAHVKGVHAGFNMNGLWRHRKKDGTLIDVEIISHVLDYNGRRAELVLAWDVTERLQAERSLRAAKSYAENLIQTANVIVLELDANGSIKVFNKAAEDITGYTFKELAGRSWFETVVPRERFPHVWEMFRTLTVGGLPKRIENPILTKSGEERYIIWQNKALREQGHIAGSISFGIDITERKRIEHRLMASELRYRRLFETAKDGILILDPETDRIVDVNPYLTDLLGYAREELVGKFLWEIGFPRDMVAPKLSCAEQKTSGDMRYDTVPLQSKDGRSLEVEFVSNLYQEAETGVIQCNIRNVTERKRMEHQASRLERLAALGQLLGGIAHELKNPLFILTGRLQLMKAKMAVQNYDTLSSDLEKIEEAARRMTHVTERFLTLAKPAQLRQVQCDLRAILTETLEFLSNELMKNQIRLIVELSPDLPTIVANPSQLQEAFLNLLLNAMQAMTKAHGQGTLTVRTQRAPATERSTALNEDLVHKWIEVRIQDDGPGILPEHRGRLFEPFFSTKPAHEGTGLGLWTVRSIIISLNGEVTYETEVGQGTTFIVRLPTSEEQVR